MSINFVNICGQSDWELAIGRLNHKGIIWMLCNNWYGSDCGKYIDRNIRMAMDRKSVSG